MKKADLVKLAVKAIFVNWSESTHINKTLKTNGNLDIDKEITLDEFEKVCQEAAEIVAADHGGYDKTKFAIIWQDGSRVEGCRIDLCASERSPIEYILRNID